MGLIILTESNLSLSKEELAKLIAENSTDAATDIIVITSEVGTLRESISSYKNLVDEQAKQLATLSEQIAKQGKEVSITEPTYCIKDGNKYKFLKTKFRIKGSDKLHLADIAKDDEAIIAEILNMENQQILEFVEEEE